VIVKRDQPKKHLERLPFFRKLRKGLTWEQKRRSILMSLLTTVHPMINFKKRGDFVRGNSMKGGKKNENFSTFFTSTFVFLFSLGIITFLTVLASAHCDTMAGTVIQDAKMALEKGDITPLLKWVAKDQEKGVREAFIRALVAKTKAPALKEKAEMHFFETLVRIHRAGEGAPFTGLKPGEAIEPIVAAADKSLETGNSDDLVKQVTDEVTAGIRKRFDKVVEKKKHVDASVKADREYVAAYVEGLYQKAGEEGGHHHGVMEKHKHHNHDEVKKESPHSTHEHY
jgi:hypothetical protein